jgi:kinetochore protein Nuf2
MDMNGILTQAQSNTSQEINQLQIKHTAARSRLVQSPERIKRYISDMSSDFSNEKKQLSDRQRTARDFQNRNEIIVNLQRDLQDLIELSRGIETRRSKLAETQRIKSSAIGKLDQKKIESQGHDAKLDVSLTCSQRARSYRSLSL